MSTPGQQLREPRACRRTAAAGADVHLSFGQALSQELGALMWSTFFLEKKRGLTLDEHFPWLTDAPRAGVWLASLHNEHHELCAGLVVRGHAERADSASIGLVCVRAEWRGQGLSQALLSGTLREVQRLGLRQLTLWTGKPEVYAKHGFCSNDEALFGWVRNGAKPHAPPSAQVSARVQGVPWPDDAERQTANRGLPPFAIGAYRLLDGPRAAQAIVVNDTNGPIVAEWQGDATAVSKLLLAALPAAWRLNALKGDELIAALQLGGAQLDLHPTHLQMWRSDGDSLPIDLPRLRFLDRI